MNKQEVVVALAVLAAASAYAQASDFISLVEIGTPQQIQAAIDKGADVNAKGVLMQNGQDGPDGGPALLWAAYNNPDPEVIATLLKAGADINARDIDGKTALIWAADINPNPDVITTLLKAGAEIEAIDKIGETSLIVAAEGNKPEVVKVLLDAGANPGAKDNAGYTAADYAAFNSHLRGTEALKQLKEASK